MNAIKEARIKHGLTQKQLADLTGIPHRTIQNWEGGQNKCPDYVQRLVLEKLEPKTVYVVLWGEDCEGAQIQVVFSNKEAAVNYLNTHDTFSRWKKVSEDERRSGCESTFIEEWNVVDK